MLTIKFSHPELNFYCHQDGRTGFILSPSMKAEKITFEPVQVFKALILMHVGMQRKRVGLQQREHGHQTAYAVLAVGKHQGSAGVTFHEIIQVGVFLRGCTGDPGLSQRLHSFPLLCEVDHLVFGFHVNLLDQSI